jgi:energy-coupling factor transporter ATP-binding protein EcfA2
MRLQTVRILNCFGFADSTIDLSPSLVYVLGRNSSGKTALLNAISNVSPHKKPGDDPRASNFNPSEETPRIEATFTTTTTPPENVTKFLEKKIRERNIPSAILENYKPLQELLTTTRETYADLLRDIANNGTLHVSRTLDGNYHIGEHARERLTKFRQIISRVAPNNQRFTHANTEYPFQLDAQELENTAATIMPPIYHFSEQYHLTADLPDYITQDIVENPKTPAARAFVTYLGQHALTERLTTNDPDRQEELLNELRARAKALSDQASATGHKLIELTLTATHHGIQITVRTDQKKSFYRHISDATKFIIAYHLYSQVPTNNAVLLFDEPTRGLHASAEHDIKNFLADLTTKNHVIISTHSEHLIDLDKLDGIRLMQQDEHRNPTVLNKLRPPRDQQGFALALQPVFDAIGLAHAHHTLTKDKVVLTEGISDYLYLRALHNLTHTQHTYGIAPGRGDGQLFTIIPFFISQGVKLKIILDHPQLQPKLQDSYGIPDNAFFLIPTTKDTRGIEDLFTTKDFQRLLANAGITATTDELQYGNSIYAKQIDKRFVAQTFFSEHAKFDLASFENDTQAHIKDLLAFCANNNWFSA